MRIKAIGTALLTTALLWGATTASAAESWYRIEMIVFLHKNAPLNSEHWPDDPGRPDGKGAVSLQRGGNRALTAPDGGYAYQPLDDKALQLNGVYAKLHRSGRYEPLLHLAWKQPTTTKAKTRPAMISTRRTGGAPPRVEGVVRISRQRYLHADIDLILNRPAPPGGALSINGGYGPAYRSYRMQASRRMRSGELHYIDHPLMGILLKITPIKQTVSEKGAAAPRKEKTGNKTAIAPN